MIELRLCYLAVDIMKLNLSSKQREIVICDSGAMLVKAGPGSGKTRVLIERIKHLLQSHKRVRILALTFSNMAAEEMRTRIQEDRTVEDSVDRVTIGTIHSFCLELVQTRGYLIGLPNNLTLFENLDDRKKVLADAMMKNPVLKEWIPRQKQNSYLTNCLSMIADFKKKFVLPDDDKIDENNRLIYSAYNQELLTQSSIDFDDILLFAYRILTEYESVARLFTTQYKYICVDEAQDLNYAQYEVIKALCGAEFKNIMLVGDENQSIYGFNGSDSSLMSQAFVRDFKPTVFVLNENFRCSRAIVNYANTLEESNDFPNCYYEGELKLYPFQSEKDEANFIISKISSLLQSGHPDIEQPLTYDDIAIIARNKYVFSEIEAALDSANIPYYFRKTTNGIESESLIFKMLDLELRLLVNSKDVIHSRELETLKKNLPSSQDYSFIHLLVSRANPDEFNLKALLVQLEDHIKKLSLPDEDKYMTFNDCDLWKKHWNKYCTQVSSDQRTLLSFRNYVALGKTQIVDSTTGVSLLTAHMSKGLQYEVVFVVGLTEGTFPDYRAVQSSGKAMEQEKNNMYVAVTRAKRLCYLTYSSLKKMPWGGIKRQMPSEFVENLQQEANM